MKVFLKRDAFERTSRGFALQWRTALLALSFKFCIAVIICLLGPGLAFGASDGAPVLTSGLSSESRLLQVENITNEIVREEIRQFRMATKLYERWVRPERFKSWRVFGYKLAGSGLTNAGMTTIAASRYRYQDEPANAPRQFLKAGHIINLTAASIVVGGTLFESVLDRISDRRLARKGLAPHQVLGEFLASRSRLGNLFEKRRLLMEQLSESTGAQREILEADGVVLQDLSKLADSEFQFVFVEVSQLKCRRDLANATTIVGSSLAGYLGSLNSLLSVANRSPKQTGVAGLGFITSGSTVMVSPLVTKFGGELARRNAMRKVSDSNSKLVSPSSIEQGEFDLSKFKEHIARLESVIEKADESERSLLAALDARKSIYYLHNAIFETRQEIRSNASGRQRRELGERLFFSTAVGGTNIARGCELVVAGFHKFDNPSETFRLVSSASTAYIVGSSLWTADNLQGKFREEVLRRRLARSAVPSVHARLLKDLESLENMENRMRIY